MVFPLNREGMTQHQIVIAVNTPSRGIFDWQQGIDDLLGFNSFIDLIERIERQGININSEELARRGFAISARLSLETNRNCG